jgi:hypothetical protein
LGVLTIVGIIKLLYLINLWNDKKGEKLLDSGRELLLKKQELIKEIERLQTEINGK